MTDAQKRHRDLRERQSKERGRMAELSRVDSLTDENRAELDTIEGGTADLERQIRAATIAVETEESEQRAAGNAARQPEGDAEDRERADLRAKVKLTGYVSAALEQRSADGAESEYNAALGIAGNRFPLELLAPPEQRAARVETRATTDVDTMTTPRRWLDRLFAETAAMRLGITMESVPLGAASFPVTTAGASAAQRQRSADAAADAAWTIGVTEMKPKRNAVRLLFSIEDAARIPGLESALTRDLGMALTEGIDRAIFLGDATATGTDADIGGLSTAAITEVSVTQANKILGPGTLGAFTGLVDGVHANMLSDLNVVAAVGAWRLWEDTVINSAAENQTLAAFLRMAGLSWTARGEIETATDDGDFAAFVGRGMGIDGAGVAAVWEAGELIRDPYSGAAKGEVALTLCYLWDFGLPRPANFARVVFDA